MKKNEIRENVIVKRLISCVIAIIIIVLTISICNEEKGELIKYSECLNFIEDGKVKEINAKAESCKIEITLNDNTKYVTYIPSSSEFWRYIEMQKESGNQIEILVEKDFFNEIIKIISIFTLIIALWIIFHI